jgi:carbamate kinase
MRIVAALGGNALIQRGQPLTVQTQRDNLASAVAGLAVLAREHQLLITQGNGPQVGLLALQAEAYAQTQHVPSRSGTPLDVLGAESQGVVGYLLQAALATEFERTAPAHLPKQRLATLLTLVEVDAQDPAFAAPSKPIGPLYTQAQMQALVGSKAWKFASEAGNPGLASNWRRVVPSPAPHRVLEIDVLRLLLDQGITVICGGGGGIPVLQVNGAWLGTEAVIDKDLTSSLMARELQADLLLLLTDVPGVAQNFGQPSAHWLRHTTPAALAKLQQQLQLPAGSMAPKVQAAVQFVQATQGRAAIGRLQDAPALVAGFAGTQIEFESDG